MTGENEKRLVEESGFFDSEWYLHMNPDVKALGMDPLEHFSGPVGSLSGILVRLFRSKTTWIVFRKLPHPTPIRWFII